MVRLLLPTLEVAVAVVVVEVKTTEQMLPVLLLYPQLVNPLVEGVMFATIRHTLQMFAQIAACKGDVFLNFFLPH